MPSLAKKIPFIVDISEERYFVYIHFLFKIKECCSVELRKAYGSGTFINLGGSISKFEYYGFYSFFERKL